MSAVRLIYALPAEFDAAAIHARLAGSGGVAAEPARRARRTYLDTFDWRVFRAGGVIEITETGGATLMRWRTLESGFVWHERALDARPRFARDLPPGKARRRLERTVDVRALLPVASERGTLARARVLDAEDKTVLGIETFRPAGAGAAPARLELLPVRGYDGALARARAALEGEGGLSPLALDPLLALTETAARRPGERGASRAPRLEPGMRTDVGCKALLASMREAMIENVEGAANDVDPEFLHDLRVAVRRTRSLLTQVPEVFADSRVRRFRREFKWLGGETGPVRDLDVYLIDFDDYRAMLPAGIADDLLPLREHLRGEKARAQARLAEVLASARFRRLLEDWGRFLDQPVPGRTGLANAARPLVEVAAERIWLVYRRTLEEGRAIGEDSPPQALHELRKTCKKLRYLLELFGPVFEDRSVRKLVKRLKRLQDNLGEFQDVHVQSEAIRAHEAAMQRAGSLPTATAHAMEHLIEVLAARRASVRAAFADRFEEYDSKKVRKRFRRDVRDAGAR